MKLCCVAVFDRASQLFQRPIFVRAPGEAVRSFTDEVNRKGDQASDLAKHPDDFDLYQLSLFDDNSGEFAGTQTLLVRGKDVSTREE